MGPEKIPKNFSTIPKILEYRLSFLEIRLS